MLQKLLKESCLKQVLLKTVFMQTSALGTRVSYRAANEITRSLELFSDLSWFGKGDTCYSASTPAWDFTPKISHLSSNQI